MAIEHARELQRHLPGIRDGDAEAVHQARVATRRLRELLGLLLTQEQRARVVRKLVRKAGHELGRVRELDVMHDMLAREQRINPVAPGAVLAAHQAIVERQSAARRRLIKRIERLELDDLPDRLWFRDGVMDRLRDRYAIRSTWGPPLYERLAGRAATLARAVSDAGGVYFPRRVHRVRVAAKKLRYTLEVAAAVHLWRPPHMLKDLRGVQMTLGDLHDVQVLVDELSTLVPEDAALPDRPTFAAMLAARANEYHLAYLASRDRLVAITTAVDRFTQHAQRRRVVAAAVTSAARTPLVLLVHIAPRALLRS